MEENKKQYAIGFDPYTNDNNDESVAVVFKRDEVSGKAIVEYLGRPNEIAFPHLIEEMKNYYGTFILEERLKAQMAIDPGANGAIVIQKPNGIVESFKMPDTPKDLFELFKSLKTQYDVECMLEKVGGMPKMGGSSMFNFGQGYGHIEMALIANEIKTTTTSPQAWQKTMLIGTKSKLSTTEWKNKLKAKAQQLYPHLKVTLGNADALLILEYAKNLKK